MKNIYKLLEPVKYYRYEANNFNGKVLTFNDCHKITKALVLLKEENKQLKKLLERAKAEIRFIQVGNYSTNRAMLIKDVEKELNTKK